MQKDSAFKVYQGTRILGKSYPFLVVTADTNRLDHPTIEHFVFTSIDGMEFICHQTFWSNSEEAVAQGITFDSFPDTFSVPALIPWELRSAQENLEHSIYTRSKEIHRELYLSLNPISFKEVPNSEAFLVQAALRGAHSSHLREMAATSRNTSLRKFCAVLSTLSGFSLKPLPKRS